MKKIRKEIPFFKEKTNRQTVNNIINNAKNSKFAEIGKEFDYSHKKRNTFL